MSVDTRFKNRRRIGNGTYGTVFKANDTLLKTIVALKVIKNDGDMEGIPATIIREITLLKKLSDHPNIIPLMDVIIEKNRYYLVFEFMKSDLRTFLNLQDNMIPKELARSYSYQLLNGVYFCHSNGVMHRDLKPENLLVTDDGFLKIGDFGLARTFSSSKREKYSPEVVTLAYRAPELLLGSEEYSTHIDIWSVGCIIAEIITRIILFDGDDTIDQLKKIFITMGTPTTKTWPGISELPNFKDIHFPQWKEKKLKDVISNRCSDSSLIDPRCIDLLKQLLTYDTQKRISAHKALDHAYFDVLDKSTFSM